jgi:hypothetical protein
MRMKNRSKLIGKIVFAALILLIIGYSFATTDDFVDFEGSTHGGCHGTNPLSSTGFIELNSSVGLNLLPSQVFTISAQVKSFTEGASQSVTIGFAQGNPGRGDNKKFTFNQAKYDGITIDGSGNSGILNFQVTAPSTFGNYTLVVDVLEGSGPSTFEWTTGTINLLIGFPSIPGAPVLENLTSTSSILELGDTQSIQIDAYDNETSVNQILIEFDGTNHSLIHSIANKLSGAGGSFTVQDTVFPIYSNYIKSSDTVEVGETANIQISATDIAGIKGVSIEIESIVHPMAYTGNDTWNYEIRVPYQGNTLDYSIKIEDNSGNLVTLEDSIQITGEISDNPSNLNDLLILILGSVTGILSISFIGMALKRRKHFF